MNTFTFSQNHYRQIKGSPMGSPLSSIVAEIVLLQIDHWITRTLFSDIQLCFASVQEDLVDGCLGCILDIIIQT
ncbi:hypothetical protein LAZ67_14001541, partial [Cordylochernes scorpioides]